MEAVNASKYSYKEEPELETEVKEIEERMQQEESQSSPENWKVKELHNSTVQALDSLNKKKNSPHLSPEEAAMLKQAQVSYLQNKVSDPVLLHLFGQKKKLQEQYATFQREAKELYQNMLAKMAEVSEATLKIQGGHENVDLGIIERLNTLKQEEDLPPPA